MRFFWYKDNDPDKEIIEYWSNVHLMGNRPSPAIANLAVRYAARKESPKNGKQWMAEDDLQDPYQSNRTRNPDHVEQVLSQQFYVDDFLASETTPEAALQLLNEGIQRLGRYQMKLCKVQSNSELVRKAHPASDPRPITIDLTPIDPSNATGTSLGLQWHIQDDEFSIKMEFKDRPKTKRGFLGHVMSPHDPFGMASPAMMSCKLLQRQINGEIFRFRRLLTLGSGAKIRKYGDFIHFEASPYTCEHPVSTYTKRTLLGSTLTVSEKKSIFDQK